MSNDGKENTAPSYEELASKVASLEKTVQDQNRRIRELETINEDNISILSRRNQKIQELESDIVVARNKESEALKKYEGQRDIANELRTSLESADKNVAIARDNSEKYKASLEKEILAKRELEKVADTRGLSMSHYEDEIVELKKEIAELTERADKKEIFDPDRIAYLEGELEKGNEVLGRLRKQVRELKAASVSQDDMIDKFKEEKGKLLRDREKLTQEIERITKILENRDGQIKELNKSVHDLDLELDSTKKELWCSEEEQRRDAKTFDPGDCNNCRFAGQVITLTHELTQKDERIEELEATAIFTSMRDLKSKLEAAKNENDALRDGFRALEEEKIRRRGIEDQVNRFIKELEEKIDSLEKDKSSLTYEIESLHKILSDRQALMERLVEELRGVGLRILSRTKSKHFRHDSSVEDFIRYKGESKASEIYLQDLNDVLNKYDNERRS